MRLPRPGARACAARTGRPEGFAYARQADGTVRISRHGRVVTVLRGARAAAFLAQAGAGDSLRAMARRTGDHQRGNERTARNHPRNSR
ncbi:hypothetical protein [Streptomyces hoynatensis]|uniref:Uncharacterized protein n=1 Tax=Streptomyces hoynatensis TaxID=1141874 RepID=A0A3A9ZIN3_9ACTN|nr:hypothetical protein [Streptomyces hoynatensis]RKN47167.1 hypothetical protein D7294_03065 [Streptomyces hoynatensis]